MSAREIVICSPVRTAIGGGLPVQVPALTVNRVCGSGAQAMML